MLIISYNLSGERMRTIKNNVINTIVIKNSKFIACLYKVNNEEEIMQIISDLKKEYKDANHYCYAYIIGNIKRFNDDGEPSGTAGMPILNVLEKNDLNNILAIVIRYFGGIKLGAGGLVRAYTKAITEVLKQTMLEENIKSYYIKINFNLDKLKVIDNILNGININNKVFTDIVTYEFNITEQQKDVIEQLKKRVNEIEIH